MRKRQEEQLRTGRSSAARQSAQIDLSTPTASTQQQSKPTNTVSAERQRLQDLAAKRQEQLRELRARQRGESQAQSQQQRSATVRTPTTQPTRPSQTQPQAPGPRQQRVSVPGPSQRPQSPARTQSASRTRQSQPTKQSRSLRATQQAAPPATQPRRPDAQPTPERARLVSRTPSVPTPTADSTDTRTTVRTLLGLEGSATHAERASNLRAMIAVQEVLSKPVSLRND